MPMPKLITKKKKNGATLRREQIRAQYWGDDDLWGGDNEKGWFRAPRTLPLVLALLSSKTLSKTQDLSSVYIELLSRHLDSGVIEMAHEAEHAFAAGYVGERAVRTWRDRMKALEDLGFIKTTEIGNQRYKYVALVHPAAAVRKLQQKNLVPDNWLRAYESRKLETKEAPLVERVSKNGESSS